MQEWELSKITLAKYSSDQEILSLLIAQLTKDFESCGIAMELELDASVQAIKNAVFKSLGNDIRSAKSKIHNLLYRIDVSENSVGQIQNNTDLNRFIDLLADVVIERELKKVLIRKHYS